MRIAILSDIHGNLTALEAVLADIEAQSPDLILHGGDLAFSGARPAECIDRIRVLGCAGVLGNADEMLCRPGSIAEFAGQVPGFRQVQAAVSELAVATRDRLGRERTDWLAGLPLQQLQQEFALVHAGRDDCWRAPGAGAGDQEMESAYAGLERPLVVYGHIHIPFVRELNGLTVANCGSVGLPFDGDRRASWLLISDGQPQIRRVEYELAAELQAVRNSDLPHAGWIERSLTEAAMQLP